MQWTMNRYGSDADLMCRSCWSYGAAFHLSCFLGKFWGPLFGCRLVKPFLVAQI
uniref:Uncharacterized protein n=1 Tax=Arundo donax TaxID=35708 RepID=A0A0A9HCI2_ARUDO